MATVKMVVELPEATPTGAPTTATDTRGAEVTATATECSGAGRIRGEIGPIRGVWVITTLITTTTAGKILPTTSTPV